MRFSSASLALLLASAAPLALVSARSCVVFDSSWNLYALGLRDGSDYSLGAQSSWKGGSAKKLTGSGRPPFDGQNTQCFLSQFNNAIYVIDGDSKNPSDIHIFNADAQSWSTQKTSLSGVDPTAIVAILDHDTNVFFGLSGGKLYQADFGQQKESNGGNVEWQDVGTPNFDTDNYAPVLALAQNHVHFLGVPGAQAGQAYIFVIHYAYFQPQVQAYPAKSGNSFPNQHGQVASFFQEDSVQKQFAFIPDDASATYIVNVENNSTISLGGPSDKSSGSTYAASTSVLVQITSSGTISYLSINQDNPSASGSSWTALSLSGLPSGGGASPSSTLTGTNTGTRSTPTSTRASTTGGGSGTGTPSASPTPGTASLQLNMGSGYTLPALGAVALFFSIAL